MSHHSARQSTRRFHCHLRPPVPPASLLALLLAALTALPAAADGGRAADTSPPGAARLQTGLPTGRIVIRFAEDSGITVSPAGLRSRTRGDAKRRVEGLLAEITPEARLDRRFSRSPEEVSATRANAEARSGKRLPDLNRYGVLNGLADTDRDSLLRVVGKLNADPAIEMAYLEPVLSVPVVEPAPGAALPRGSTTPDFSGLQGYRLSPPLGVGAVDVLGIPGADGSGVKLVDIEHGWLWTHEDLVAPFVEIGTPSAFTAHGTFVMGVIRGSDNGFGVIGIAPGCEVGGASVESLTVAECVDAATAVLSPGDLILLEVHGAGPYANNGGGTTGFVPVEFWQDNFDAIQIATASGIVVVAAAGNGYHSLDDPIYEGRFDRNVRDSGAILVGSSANETLAPSVSTNSGSRVDVHGWGGNVTTSGGGSLYGWPTLPETQWYTSAFNATSAASAIVAGAVTSLQGAVKAAFGFPLDSYLMRSVLSATGTPQDPGPNIGPRPDLLAAWNHVSAGVGTVAGTVTEAGTGTPIENVSVTVVETGTATRTNATGGYTLPLTVGNYTLRLDGFFHFTQFVPVTITHDAATIADADMTPRPTTNLVALAHGTDLQPIAGVRVTPLNLPIPEGLTGADGRAHLGSVPAGTLRLLYDGIPGLGAAYREVTVLWEGPPPPSVELAGRLAPTAEDFEAGDAGWVSAQGLWQWGTPQSGGPSGGFSGSKCWGIGMTDDYPDSAADTLFTPPYNFSAGSPPALFLSLHYWSETESNYDGVAMDVGNLGSFGLLYFPREPLNDYTLHYVDGLKTPGLMGYGAAGWTGSTGGWRSAVFDLTDRIPFNTYLRFRFGSDVGVNGEGFWIDDITFDTGIDSSAVVAAPVVSPAGSGIALSAFPNPTSTGATFAWRAPGEGDASIELYDVAGRRVRTLATRADLPQSGTVRWDGAGNDGRRLAPGVYWVRFERDGDAAVRKVVLVR